MAHKSLRTLIKEADTFAGQFPPRIIDVPCLIFSSSCIGAADRVPRVLVANKCDKLASDNDEARVQLEQARAWAQRAGLAFIECSASAPYNVDALFVLVATYLGQIATLPRSVPRWFAPRWGRTTAGKWLAERRIVGSFVVYPWFWRRKQSQHDAACSHSGSAGFELAEIVVGNNNELFVQHKSIAVSRVLPPAGYVDPDPARRSPIVLRFVLSGQKRGFPSMTAIILCHKLLRLDSYRLTALVVPPPDPKDFYAGATAASGGNTLSRVKKSLLLRMGSRTRSPVAAGDAAAGGAGAAPAQAGGSPRGGSPAPAEPAMSPADAADQPALLEGELRVQTQTVSKKSGWKRRYVSILRDRLCIYSSEKDRTRRVAPVEMLKLIDCNVALITATDRQQLELTLPGAPSKRVFRPVEENEVMQNWHDVLKRTVTALGTLDVDTPMPEPDAPAAQDDNADAEADTGAGGGAAVQRSFFDLPADNDDGDEDAAAYDVVVPLKPAAAAAAAPASGAAPAADVVVVVDDDVSSSSTTSERSADEPAFADAIESSNGSAVIDLMPADAAAAVQTNSGAASDDDDDDGDDDDDDDDDNSKNDDRGKMKKDMSSRSKDEVEAYVVLSAAPQAVASDTDDENGSGSPSVAKRFWSEDKTAVAPAQQDVVFDANNPFSAALARSNEAKQAEARKGPGLDADRMRAARFLTNAGYGAEPALRALQEADGDVENAVQILVKWAIDGQVVGKAVDEPDIARAAASSSTSAAGASPVAAAAASSSTPASPVPAQMATSVIVSPVAPSKPLRSDLNDEAARQREADEANIMAAKHAAALAANEDLIKQTYARRKAMLLENARQTNMPLQEFVRLIEYEAQQVAFALSRERHRFDTNQLTAANERQRAQLKHLLANGNGGSAVAAKTPAAAAEPAVAESLGDAAKRFSLSIVAADQLTPPPGPAASQAPTAMGGSRLLTPAMWRDVPVGVLSPSDDDVKSDKAAALAALEREAVLLCRLRHPHIVALLAVRGGGAPGLIVPLSRSTTLEALFAVPTALTTVLSRLRVARCVARALVHLHYVCKPPIVHRNVRPSSILCSAAAPHEAKLAGFEWAQPVAGESVPFVVDDAPRWTAPELLNESAYDGRVDVYSFGILLWQLLANRLPFGDADSQRSVRARIQSGVRPDPALMIDKIEAAAAAASKANGGGGGTMSIGGTSALAGLAARAWSAHADQRPTMGDAAKVLANVCAGVEKKEAQQEEDRQLCSVCLDQPRCMAFVPCGHVATCETCSRDLRGHPCVICFAQSSASIKVFL
jgi:hypothetical protein